MKRAEVMTPWGTDTGTPPSNVPQLLLDHNIYKYEDVTRQPVANIAPEPNAMIALVEMEDAIAADVEADPNYLVLWMEDIV